MIVEHALIEQDGGMPVLVTVDHLGRLAFTVFGDESDARYIATEMIHSEGFQWCRVGKDLEASHAPGTKRRRLLLGLNSGRKAARVKRFAEMLRENDA